MTAQILLVDDEPDMKALVLQKFRHQIRDGAIDFLFAGDGVEALAMLEENSDTASQHRLQVTLLRRERCKAIVTAAQLPIQFACSGRRGPSAPLTMLLATFTSRTILSVPSTTPRLVTLTETSSPAKWSMLRFSF
jgi:hypothetical protein